MLMKLDHKEGLKTILQSHSHQDSIGEEDDRG